jgi:CheY-like chemotaxis protein
MSYRVLICDDSSLARKMAKRSLPEGFAMEVCQAEHGVQAVELLQQSTFDLLLLDLTMPVMDGLGVLGKLRELAIDTLTIVVSGDIQPDMQKRVLGLGAMAFLPKPIDAQRMQATLTDYGFV